MRTKIISFIRNIGCRTSGTTSLTRCHIAYEKLFSSTDEKADSWTMSPFMTSAHKNSNICKQNTGTILEHQGLRKANYKKEGAFRKKEQMKPLLQTD